MCRFRSSWSTRFGTDAPHALLWYGHTIKADGLLSDFTNDRARQRFHTAYGVALTRLWPEAPTPIPVPTRYGEAVAYRTGAAHGTPVVLLPGAGGSTLTWYQYVARLARRHPVIALDPVGEPGAARQTYPIAGAHDAAVFLADALAALEVEHAHLVGMSYGGWTALCHEVEFPGRAASLTLLDPAGFGARFWAWLIAGGLAGLTPGPIRRRLAGPVRNATLRDEELMPLLPLIMAFRRRLPVPQPLTDGELSAIATPTLVLLGERSALYHPTEVAAHLARVMPAARVEIVPGASHDLPAHSPELVADHIERFLPA